MDGMWTGMGWDGMGWVSGWINAPTPSYATRELDLSVVQQRRRSKLVFHGEGPQQCPNLF